MTEISIEIRGLKETQREMERIVRDLRGEPYLNAMRRATLLVQRSAKIKAPVDTGRLRASITPEVRWQGNTAVGVVGSNVEYAPFQELGTAAGARSMGTRMAASYWHAGTKGHPFLRPALEENAERIVRMLGDAVGDIVTEGGE